MIVADAGEVATAEVARAVAASATEYPVRLVSTAELSLAGWTHRIDPAGRTSTTLRLADGTRFDRSIDVSVAYLASTTPVPRFLRSAAADQDYAASEFRALMVSWLYSLGDRVVNAPSGTDPSGPGWSPGRWLIEAAGAGLPVARACYATSARLLPDWHGPPGGERFPALPPAAASHTVLVAGDHVAGPLSDQFRPACGALSKRSGCRVISLQLGPGPSGPGVVSATACGSPRTPEQVWALARFLVEWFRNP
jgi:hypothetical protein